jgi:predicted Rossmann-fold nucleotide-binding protein
MLTRVISGGQTGVDQAALRAAKTRGIATGGFAPKGWLTEKASWCSLYRVKTILGSFRYWRRHSSVYVVPISATRSA